MAGVEGRLALLRRTAPHHPRILRRAKHGATAAPAEHPRQKNPAMPSAPTRRDLLAAFLGLPALAGCGARTPPLPDGKLVGASLGLGHRLRQAPPPRPPAGAWQRVGVVIV